jgi:5-methylcytosine-specific restriction protein B
MDREPLKNAGEANFEKLCDYLRAAGDAAKIKPSFSQLYQEFITRFPKNRLQNLSLDEYCVGKKDRTTFCWWIERGLQSVLGRYMPGTSRGHIIYFMPDGTVYKNRLLENLSDQAALEYTLKIQSAIAAADVNSDLGWIDNENQLYARAGVENRVTIGDGRKLRLLAVYNPENFLPISSSEHLGYFLTLFGANATEVPALDRPVARSQMLSKIFSRAQQNVPGITPYGFMRALYTTDLKPPKRSNPTPQEDEFTVEDVGEVMEAQPLNQILFGPPGTGKTYSTIDAALKILDHEFLIEKADNRSAIKARFDEYVKNQQVCFVTFHQSFSYEDFVEGISAVIPDGEAESSAGGLPYEIKDGVFLQICDHAKRNETLDEELGVRDGAKIWKISIEESNSSGETRQYCFKHGEARIGWSRIGDIRTTDLSAPEYKLGTNAQSSITNFGCDIVKGDVLLCFGSLSQICAVGVVTGDYEFTPKVPVGVREDYIHKLPVKWLATDLKFDITTLNHGRGLTLKTVYQLSRIKWPSLQDALIKEGVALGNQIKAVEKNNKPYVLIVDEINRGNISRIFGELITLIEPSKRIGADEELTVTLPYSKLPFGVPDNLYIIGTMNTSDRSLAGMDVALRRRFTFIEMPPKYRELNEIDIDGVNVGELLKVINERIEVLLGRDYCIGHAYFMDLQKSASLSALAAIFKNKILPLLQEYFFEDWQRIRWVLNDHRKPKKDYQFITEHELAADTLFGAGVVDNPHKLYRIQDTAFDSALSFVGILDASKLGLAKVSGNEAVQ